MGEVIRESSNDGVKVTVVAREESFDILVDIEAGTVLCKKRNQSDFVIKFDTGRGPNTAKQNVHFEYKDLSYGDNWLNQSYKQSFAVAGKIYGSLSLSRKFYLSEERMAQYKEKTEQDDKKQRIKKEEKRKRRVEQKQLGLWFKKNAQYGNIHETVHGGHTVTIYSKNNLTRPYGGGKCSPK